MPVIDIEEENKEAQDIKPKSYTWVAILFLVFTVILVGGAFGAIFFLGQSYQDQQTTVEGQISNLEVSKRAKQEEAKQAIEVSKKINDLNTLLEDHICMSKVFDAIEKTTDKKVFFETIALEGTEGTLALEGKAATYKDAADQLAVYRAQTDSFMEASTKSVALVEDRASGRTYVSFSPQMKLNKDLFLCESKDNKEISNNNK